MDHHPQHLHHDHHHHPTTTAATTDQNPTRAEGERLLGIAEKLLQTRDLTGSREFALLSQETDPLLEGSDQILAITDVLLASEKRVINNRHHDWYGILQTDRRLTFSDPDLIKKNYRRLALLLHPDKNRYPLSDSAFKLVADAWAVLSDPSKRTPYDHELSLFSKVDLRQQPPPPQQQDKDKLPVRRSSRGGGGEELDDDNNNSAQPPPRPPASGTNNYPRSGVAARSRLANNFWTACPYCYVLYEYPKVYEECCLRCQNCERAFHAASIPTLPPMVQGKEAYYCCWGFFPLGFSLQSDAKGKKSGANNVEASNNNQNNANVNNVGASTAAAAGNNSNSNTGFPNWMPGMFTTPMAAAQPQGGGMNANMMNMNMNVPYGGGGGVDLSDGSASPGMVNHSNASAGFAHVPSGIPMSGQKKRGRPRKNPFPV